jgi:integrase
MGTSSQRGYVTPRGKKWYGYFRKTVIDPTKAEQKTVRVTVILGHRSRMKRSEARDALEREIIKQNGHTGDAGRVMNDGSVSFGWFVRNRYLPLKESNWKEETIKVKKLLIQRDLIDAFDTVPLKNLDKFTLQLHLNSLALSRSRDRVLQMRAYLRDIFVEAVDQDFLSKDPARKVKVPAQLRETDKTTLSWEQLRKALSGLSLRDRVLLELDMTNALRPSELFALRWKGFDPAASTMNVSETAYRGKIRPWGKTRKSLGVVHIPKKLVVDLKRWREHCSNPSPEAFIFPNKDGELMDTGNYRKRVLLRLATDLKLPKLTFQVIRRTIATLAQKKGTVKDVQGVLRHSRVATTTDVYMQQIPKSVQATVDSINAELRKRSTRTPQSREGVTSSKARRDQDLTPNPVILTPNDTKLKSGISLST